MPIILLSDETMRLLRSNATQTFKQNAVKVQDSWETPVSEDTLKRIQAQALPGETPDETLLRVLSIFKRGAQ